MEESELISESDVPDNGRINDKIKKMTEELYDEMNGTVSRTTIEQTLVTLFANLEEASVKLFVPIFVRRQAKDILRKMVTQNLNTLQDNPGRSLI